MGPEDFENVGASLLIKPGTACALECEHRGETGVHGIILVDEGQRSVVFVEP
jgi:hypothetical protein